MNTSIPTRYRCGMAKRLQIVNIRLDDQLKADLKALADNDERPLASFIVWVLRRYAEAEKAKKTRSEG